MKILIDGMTCEHCKKFVTEAISAVEGTSGVEVNLEEKCATFTASPDLKDAVVNAIQEEGYTVLEVIE